MTAHPSTLHVAPDSMSTEKQKEHAPRLHLQARIHVARFRSLDQTLPRTSYAFTPSINVARGGDYILSDL